MVTTFKPSNSRFDLSVPHLRAHALVDVGNEEKHNRRFTIVPCNRVIFGREEDSPLIEKLMAARGFIPGKG